MYISMLPNDLLLSKNYVISYDLNFKNLNNILQFIVLKLYEQISFCSFYLFCPILKKDIFINICILSCLIK